MEIPEQLLDGYRAFKSGRYIEEAARYQALAAGQSPHTMIIACADSRVDPATIFAAGPGELFVVRNVAAIVPPCEPDGRYHGTSAAIEFAVTGLGINRIVIMAHGQCGGIAAALAGSERRPVGQFIGPWVDLLADVRDTVIERIEPSQPLLRQKALERLAVQHSLDNLMTFPFVSEAVDAGRLTLHGAWFAISDGKLHWLERDTGVFVPVEV